MESANLTIDVFSDTVCPWCFVGKRHLEQALAARPAILVDLHWQPFQLNPQMPEEGVDRKTYWREKFGSEERLRPMVERLQTMGASLNIDFQFDQIQRQPNTLKSHMLLMWSQAFGQQSNLKEKILSAFFEQGLDIGDPEVLISLAMQCGLDGQQAKDAMLDQSVLESVRSLDGQAREMGISSVPTFVFNREQGVSGAHPPEVLTELMDKLTGV